MQVFATLKLLMGLLEPILGPSGPKKGPQNWSKSAPKSVQKLVQNMTYKITKNEQIWGPKLAPRIPEIGEGRLRANEDPEKLHEKFNENAQKRKRTCKDNP